jgi:hypothetical protein
MHSIFVNTDVYSPAQILLYAGGFLAWTPAYVAIIYRAIKRRQLEMPVVAAVGNITWELLWGFAYKQNMGWGLDIIYKGAFIIDVFIFWAVIRFGAQQIRTAEVRRYFPVLVGALVVGWLAFYAGLKSSHYELPMGSIGAYLDNLEMSALYLWLGLTLVDPRRLSPVVAWSKGIGTLMVTVFVFLVYPDNAFVKTLAIMVGVLDVTYIAVLLSRLRRLTTVDDEPLSVGIAAGELLQEGPVGLSSA